MILRLLLFYFLLTLFFVDSAGYGNCPYRCECHPHHSIPSGWKAECNWDSLPTDSPFAVSSSIRSLSIRCSPSLKSASLSATTLKGLHQLHELRIHKCPISNIDVDAFKSLEELKELVLTEVSSDDSSLILSDESILHLHRLHTFQLSDSRLTTLPSSFFCSLSNLQMLNISGNDLRSSSISSNSPCIAGHLIIVDLSRNRLGEILSNTLEVFPVVRQLLLGDNSITSIHSLAFNKTRLLQQLNVERNELRNVGVLPDTVVSVNIAHNSLSSVPLSIQVLPNLVFLNMSHNSLSSSIEAIQSTDLENVDFSFNGLTQIPSIWNSSVSTVNQIDLSHNSISSISREDFHLMTALNTLNLGHNSLSIVEEGALSGLSSLSSLDLSHNEISLLSPSSLGGLNVDYLTLSHNQLSQVPLALSHLTRCKSIDLSSNSISSISSNIFSKIVQLARLDMSNNKLEKISQYELSECSHLTWISLSHNSIRDMTPYSLTGCPSLRRLDLSLNRLPSINIKPSDLNSLRHLNLSSNLLASLDWEGIPLKIEYLHVDHNRMRTLKGTPAYHRIRVLSLSHNGLSSLSSSLLPDSIESIDISFNSISSIAPSTFASKAALTNINLSWNGLRSITLDSIDVPDATLTVSIHIKGNPLECSCEMEWIKNPTWTTKQLRVVDMGESECIHPVEKKAYNLTTIDKKQMLCNYTRACDPGCDCCAFSSCDCKSECPRGCECWVDADKNTNVVRCNALRGSDAEKFSIREIPMHATHIYLSEFPIGVLKKHSFFGRTRLLHVHLNKTSLRLIEPMAFNKAPSLQLLDVSMNELREFGSDVLFKTGNITHLFLDHNRLERIDDELIRKLPKLRGLTLHSNGLERVSDSLATLDSLTLSSNPYRCDCEMDTFTAPAFLLNHREKILDSSRMRCIENVTRALRENDTTILSFTAPNEGYGIFNMSMNEFLHGVNSSLCSPVSGGIFGSTDSDLRLLFIVALFLLLLLITVIVLIVSAIRRNRCGMRRKGYKLNSSLNCSTTPGTSPLPVPLLGYDVFISYSQKDEKLVYEKITRQLESDYSLCLLHRDGPKYDTLRHAVSDELTHLMKSSNAIIVVITKNFLAEEWKSTHIKISHKLVAKDRPIFLAVFGDDVDMNEIDEELGAIVRKNEWTRFNDHLYYNTLQNILPLPSRHFPSDDTSQIYSELCGGVIVQSAI
ncbi:hypothetical protein PFISCL1PPCAC_19697, partial [Pristionchus fissidentatus]